MKKINLEIVVLCNNFFYHQNTFFLIFVPKLSALPIHYHYQTESERKCTKFSMHGGGSWKKPFYPP